MPNICALIFQAKVIRAAMITMAIGAAIIIRNQVGIRIL